MNDFPIPSSEDSAPAAKLLLQLESRITAQGLHFRSGGEQTASDSVYKLFELVRGWVIEYPRAMAFIWLAMRLINRTIRPYTARWHGWVLGGRLAADATIRRTFRAELQQLQEKILPYGEVLRALADGTVPDSAYVEKLEAVPEITSGDAWLGEPVAAGIGDQVDFAGEVDRQAINDAEHRAIRARREIFGLSAKADAGSEPALMNATGLALSGGGIRSASYSLGVTQVLIEKGFLPQIDYLSTVSGGGYFGTFLDSALHPDGNSKSKTSPEPMISQEAKTPPKPETPQERIKEVFGSERQHESVLIRHLRNSSRYLVGGGAAAGLKRAGLILGGSVLNFLLILPLPLVAALLVLGLDRWVHFWGTQFPSAGRPGLETPVGRVLVVLTALLAGFGVLLPVIQRFLSRFDPDSPAGKFRRFWVGATLASAVGVALAGCAFLLPAFFHAFRPAEELPGAHSTVTGGTLGLLAAGLLVVLLALKWRRLQGLAVKLFILAGPLFFLAVFLKAGLWVDLGKAFPNDDHALRLLIATAVLWVWGWLFVNVNLFSLHPFYRDRLCDCYLVRKNPEAKNGVELVKHLPLSKLKTEAAPYRLINATVNLPSSKNPELRGRKGDFFLFSPNYCGSPLVGYGSTEAMEKRDPHLDIGSATAISGAAAGTNMGWKTRTEFLFLLSVLNVRLAYWLRNPGKKGWPAKILFPGPWYLLREMFGSMNEDCYYLNISDGGHIENLGVYELLRRRCKFIISVDAGMECGLECADLIRLQRYAEIDLGIRLHFDLADFALETNGRTRAYATLVVIEYPPRQIGEKPEVGWMIYLKPCLTGEEPGYISEYKRLHPDFPHETTADQLYSEEQFEAYRRLGECAAKSLFAKELMGITPPGNLEGWFQRLASSLLPDNHPALAAQ